MADASRDGRQPAAPPSTTPCSGRSSRPAPTGRAARRRPARVALPAPGPSRLVARLGACPGWRDAGRAGSSTAAGPASAPSVVARTRLIDDAIVAARRRRHGARSSSSARATTRRAYRLPCLRDVAVFEVDHPDTQRAKRRALQRVAPQSRDTCGTSPPTSTTGTWRLTLAAGYRDTDRTLFLWEGVTNYLTRKRSTPPCAGAPTPRRERADLHLREPRRARPPGRYAGADRLFAPSTTSANGSPSASTPRRRRRPRGPGLVLLERDLGAAEYRRQVFGAAAERMRGHEFYRVAIARIFCRILSKSDRITGY